MEWYDALAGVGDFAAKLFNTGYSIYQDNRDFEYQKQLQQDIFNREDNAVQRRMADLKAAGLNPNLAAGSAAGAGAAVGRSNSKNVDLGSVLDTMAAYNQVQLQRQERDNKRTEGEILKAQKESTELSKFLQEYTMALDLGFDVSPVYDIRSGKFKHILGGESYGTLEIQPFNPGLINLQNSLNKQNLVNSANILQLDADFYESNKWIKVILPILSILGQGGNTAANFIRAFK